MADHEEKSEEQLLAEQVAAIEAEEKTQADANRVAAMRLRVQRSALKKETEKRLGPEGKAFEIVEADDGLLVVVSKPSAVIWKAFQSEERSQATWERLYRACVDASVWDKLSKQLEDSPLGVENAVVSAIMRLQGSKLEVHAKK